MSDLSISSNIFLGKQELDHLKASLRDEGYAKLFQNSAVSYGVVQKPTDLSFTNLEVYKTAINQIGVRAGIAIDSNINVIEVKEDLLNLLTLPSDSVTRYVVISYTPTTIEEGTVNIQADGSIIGVDTKFISRLRGLPDFPSKISFESTVNTGEYTIRAVQSDTLASLNVGQSSIVVENEVQYKVVGTFTPAITVPTADKYPFINNGYTIELRDSNVLSDNEYLLAEASFNGSEISILDKRLTNKFSLIDESVEVITDENRVVGVEQIMYDSVLSTMHENNVKIGWGIESQSGDWAINSNTQELTVSSGQGGAWGGLAPFSDGDFDKWNVVFEKTGQVIKVQKSLKVGTAVLLELNFSETYPTDGNISITPNSDHVEITVLNASNPTGDKRLTFASISRYAIVKLEAGTTSVVQYKHVSRDQMSLIRTVNNGSYILEPSFDESGIAVSQSSKNYFDGLITPLLSKNNLYDRLTCNFIRIWGGSSTDIPSGYFLCDGENGTVDLRGQFVVGCDPRTTATEFKTVGETGGLSKVQLETGDLPAHGHTGTVTDLDHTHNFKDGYMAEKGFEGQKTPQIPEFGAEIQNDTIIGSGSTDSNNTVIIYKNRSTDLPNTDIEGNIATPMTGKFDSDTTGNDQSHENLPPYYTVCFIMRPCDVVVGNEVQGNILDLSTLQHFKNDAAAALGNIAIGQFYLADKPNTMGMQYGAVKRREA